MKEIEQLFLYSCETDDLVEVKRILDINDFNINCTDCYGHTGLFFVSSKGFNEIAELLIEKGVDINRQNDRGFTALMYAARGDNSHIVNLLIKSNLHLKNNDGNTALYFAAYLGLSDILKTLITHGAAVNARHNDGRTSLHHAAYHNDIEVAEILTNNGADITIKSNLGETAFDEAKNYSNAQMMYFFDKNSIHEQDENGRTLLMNQCVLLNENNIMFLYEKQVDFFIKDNNGNTAFDILVNDSELPDKLQALKEKLMLEMSINDGPSL